MYRAPRPAYLPHLHSILNDIGKPLPDIAKLLDIDSSTLRRYKAAGQAPRAVMLALFWETSWGRSRTDTEAINRISMLYQENQLLKRKQAKLQSHIERLEKELEQDYAAANSPLFDLG